MERTLAMRIIFLVVLIGIALPVAHALDVTVADSKDWTDVYSVMLHGALQGGTKVTFLNSETMTGFVRTVSPQAPVQVFESTSTPYISGFAQKLRAAGYNVTNVTTSPSFDLALDPQNGRYIVISQDYYRIAAAVAPVAIKEDRWVLIVNENNVDQVAQRLQNAKSVIAVGSFRRDLLDKIKPSFTDWIHNDSIFVESQKLAERYGETKSVILADGFSLESEFFTAHAPVLLSGYNKIVDQTYNWMSAHGVKNVVIIGNKLAVVGEQIRQKSNDKIAIFIKFGQSDTQDTGKIYALTMFPLPQPLLGLTVQKAIYDPQTHELIAYLKNIGNIGLYETTTVSVKNGKTEIGSGSDSNIPYLGVGEVYPERFNMTLPIDQINGSTNAEFYTSYGLSPSQLDSFLTMENKYGPPFTIPLTVQSVNSSGAKLVLEDVSYYTRLNRVGVTVLNNGTGPVSYDVKIKQLVVNGLPEDLYKSDTVAPGKTKTTYLPAQLDKVDLQDNTKFNVDIVYGKDPNNMLDHIATTRPFTTSADGLLNGLAIGGAGAAIGGLVVLLLIVGIGMVIYIRSRN